MPPFVARLPVRFADVDHAGIVYYPVFFHYFHVAFEEMFRERMGIRAYVELLDDRRIGFPAVSSKASYQVPLRFGDEVEIAVSVTRLGTKSITFHYLARRAADAVTSADGEIVCAVVDLESFRAIPIPDDLREFFLEISETSQVKRG